MKREKGIKSKPRSFKRAAGKGKKRRKAHGSSDD